MSRLISDAKPRWVTYKESDTGWYNAKGEFIVLLEGDPDSEAVRARRSQDQAERQAAEEAGTFIPAKFNLEPMIAFVAELAVERLLGEEARAASELSFESRPTPAPKRRAEKRRVVFATLGGPPRTRSGANARADN